MTVHTGGKMFEYQSVCISITSGDASAKGFRLKILKNQLSHRYFSCVILLVFKAVLIQK